MKRVLIFILIILPFCGVKAQQEPQYSQYMFNGLVINPAYAGSRGHFSGVVIAREQWAGMDGAPSTQSLSFNGTNRSRKHGYGFSLINDRIGVTSNLNVNAVYAFRIQLAENSFLSLGLNGSLTNYRANLNDVRLDYPGDPTVVDPSFTGNQVNELLPNAGAGIYFNSERFYVGASSPRLIQHDISGNGVSASQAAHYFVTGGAMFNVSTGVKFKPSVMMKYQSAAPVQFDINAQFLFMDKFWLGASYRTEDAVVFMAEFQVTQLLRLGYAYDLNTSELRAFNSGSHEFMLGFDFDFEKSKMVSPRYF